MVMTVKMTVFWDVMMCSLLDNIQLIRGTYSSIFNIEAWKRGTGKETQDLPSVPVLLLRAIDSCWSNHSPGLGPPFPHYYHFVPHLA
jgi:hypothetical protein